MHRRIILGLVCLVLAGTHTTGAPRLVGPTASAGYFFSLKVSPRTIVLGAYDMSAARQVPTKAAVVVRVQDGQGRPVDGVAVAFALEPAWSGSAVLSPSTTVTHGGVARTIFSAPQTTGRVQITARVDNTIARTALVVQIYEERPEME